MHEDVLLNTLVENKETDINIFNKNAPMIIKNMLRKSLRIKSL